ncbi:MAG: hypothetical protein V2A75_09260 [Pseudomonadota bacterium]
MNLSNIEQEEYCTFLLFKRHVEVLRTLRPDIYMSFGNDEHAFSIKGEDAKNMDDYESKRQIVMALNASIILNTTSFFEGFLENILLRKIGKTTALPEHIKNIIEEYQQQILRISSFADFKKYFQKLFHKKITDVLNMKKNDLDFIDKFYTVRHLLSHGSCLDTASIKLEIGRKLFHTDSAYIALMKALQERYSHKYDLNIDFMSLLNFSEVIDDFSNTIFDIATKLAEELKKNNLIDSSGFWGDFSGRGMWGEI